MFDYNGAWIALSAIFLASSLGLITLGNVFRAATKNERAKLIKLIAALENLK